MFKTNFPGHNTLWGEDQKCLRGSDPEFLPVATGLHTSWLDFSPSKTGRAVNAKGKFQSQRNPIVFKVHERNSLSIRCTMTLALLRCEWKYVTVSASAIVAWAPFWQYFPDELHLDRQLFSMFLHASTCEKRCWNYLKLFHSKWPCCGTMLKLTEWYNMEHLCELN